MLFFVIILVVIALELSPQGRALRADMPKLWRKLQAHVPYENAPVALGGLVLTFVIELLGVGHLNAGLVRFAPWIGNLPVSVTLLYPFDLIPVTYRAETLMLAAVETLFLGVYLLAMHGRLWRRVDTIASVGAALAIVVFAVLSPAISSMDMYAYIADGLLGNRAYTPPLTPLPPPYAVIHHMWELPLLPAAYGPAWLWWNHGVDGLVDGLYAKLLLLRLENVAALAAILVALRRLGVAPCFIAAMAVNPAIAFYYVSDGHNDLFVMAIVIVAMTFAERFPVLAGIVAGIGASMKLTLILPAAAGGLAIATLPKRLMYVAIVSAVAVGIAVIIGGEAYFHALMTIAQKYAPANQFPLARIAHVVVALLVIGLTAAAVLLRRSFAGGAFGFAALAQAFFPWYAIWGLPYAVTRRDVLAPFLIGMPVMMALLDIGIAPKLSLLMIVFAVIAVAGVMLRRANVARREARA